MEGGVWGKAPMALRRSRGSRGWPLGVINNQIGGFGVQPRGSPQEWGLGQRPNSPPQEQGFKGLAPWCINNHHISYLYIHSQLTPPYIPISPPTCTRRLYNKNDIAWGGTPMGFGAAPQVLRRSGVRGA